MFYLPCDKFLAFCCRWHILKEARWRKVGLLLVGKGNLGCGLPGVLEVGKCGEQELQPLHIAYQV